jgi:hypothetical protein
MASPFRRPKLAESLGFDLPDALARNLVEVADFLEGMAAAIDQAKAHFEDLPFPFAEAGENVVEFFFEHAVAGALGRVFGALVFDKVSYSDVAIIADGSIQ